ncbi:MAG: RNA 2',3'-cyclic phosphodiesterase [Bryobacteraceae bacterium]|nr:RNA 2',3'-cyclic phosphodiesterase [Bryobacteraceae bacterium]
MRLFCAIDLPYQVRRNLELLLQLLRPKADLQWSPPSNLHVTTKFIGEWPEEDLEILKEALAAVPAPGEFAVDIQGLGWFPDAANPRVFWAGVRAGEPLQQLARATEDACARLGIARENRPYSPHLTLARIRRPVDLGPLRSALASLASDHFGRFTAAQFHLYESKLRPGGSIYTKLASFPLKK